MEKTKKKQRAQENHKSVFKLCKVVREFQTGKKKSQLSLMAFRVVKQCQNQKYSLDFEKDEGFIDMWQLQLLMTSIRASSVKW